MAVLKTFWGMSLANDMKVLFLFLGLLASMPAAAATWRVELDGSGDFDNTWDAALSADAGDTLLLGAGRFDEVHRFYIYEPRDQYLDTHLYLPSRDITVIGQGPGVTVLGHSGDPDVYGILAFFQWNDDYDAVLRIENLGIENTRVGLYANYEEMVIHVSNVEFKSCETGIRTFNRESSVTNCLASDIQLYAFSGVGSVINCEIESTIVGIHAYGECLIEGTVFRDCETAIEYTGSTFNPPNDPEGNIIDCDLTENIEVGISASQVGKCNLNSNRITASLACVSAENNIVVTGSNNVFTSAGGYILYGRLGARYDLQGNDILHSNSLYAVGIYQYFAPPEIIHDLTGNWWGDYSEADLPQHIHDGNVSNSVYSFVEYLPMAGDSVPASSVSWGSFKASFR